MLSIKAIFPAAILVIAACSAGERSTEAGVPGLINNIANICERQSKLRESIFSLEGQKYEAIADIILRLTRKKISAQDIVRMMPIKLLYSHVIIFAYILKDEGISSESKSLFRKYLSGKLDKGEISSDENAEIIAYKLSQEP